MNTFPTIAEPYTLTQTRHGLMLVNHNDIYMGQALLKYGECCELELEFLVSLLLKPGLVVDVGANMGIHTVPLARHLAAKGGRVLALEPQPFIFQQLCANLALNGLMNVIALPYACGAENGALTFQIPDYLHRGNFGGTAMHKTPAGQGAQQVVQCARLEDLIPEGDVGLIKIDAEGFELDVLKGSAAILQRCAPILYMENDRIEKSPALLQWLMNHDYRMWWHITPLYNPDNFRGDKEDVYPTISSVNMFCLPRTHRMRLKNFAEIVDPAYHPFTPGAPPPTVTEEILVGE